MNIAKTRLQLSGERVSATYELRGDAAEVRAKLNHLVVEQTIEFPLDLVIDDEIRRGVVGREESLFEIESDVWQCVVSYAEEVTAFQGPQLLNMLFGNISLVRGVRLVGFDLSPRLAFEFRGPRYGLEGLRERLKAPTRPLLATALKPMGMPLAELGAMATDLVAGGIDIIKDDHGFADQPFARFSDRVRTIARTVSEANRRYDRDCLYLAFLNVPSDMLLDATQFAMSVGAADVLALPGLHGFDAMRRLADDDELRPIVMSHPSMLGSYVASDESGMAHSVVFGLLARLFGADLSIYPNFGGRFAFTPQQCRSILDALVRPIPGWRKCVPAPAGGMTVEKAGEIFAFYGTDVALLIGGDLHRGNRRSRALQLRELAEAAG